MKGLFFIGFIFFASCYVSKKLDSTATIKFSADFNATVSLCNEPKYLSANSSSSYKNYFLGALRSEMKENNLILQDSGNADYELSVTALKFIEDVSSEGITDDSSSQNGEK